MWESQSHSIIGFIESFTVVNIFTTIIIHFTILPQYLNHLQVIKMLLILYVMLHIYLYHTHTHTHEHYSNICLTKCYASSAGNATPLEHLVLAAIITIPVLGTCLLGYGSVGLIYGYLLMFDFLRCLGHCNVEIVPHELFQKFPFLRYILYTPT